MDKRLLTLENQFAPSILTPIHAPFLRDKKIELWLKRDDLIHPIISGNKWRKLKYSLNHALAFNKKNLISMGGAYSNHLHALAFAGRLLNLKTKAFIRGERPALLNATLQDLLAWGMELEFMSRSAYRELRTFKLPDALPNLNNTAYWIPEGGANSLALTGVGELVTEITSDYDVICTACGTGSTLAGIIQAMPQKATAMGFAALKGADFLTAEVATLLPVAAERKNWQIHLDYHFGGFGKTKPQLLDFISNFERQHGIALEPIYTGKMLFGLYDLIQQDYFPAGHRIIALHTGGLQGNRKN
jgi:1-aminocyclopropane-1-carboxylate deaminase